jgi:hypothetical protein
MAITVQLQYHNDISVAVTAPPNHNSSLNCATCVAPLLLRSTTKCHRLFPSTNVQQGIKEKLKASGMTLTFET